MPLIIAFHGKPGSGKDAAADHIIDSYGVEWVQKKMFSQPLDMVVRRVNVLIEEPRRDTKRILTRGRCVTAPEFESILKEGLGDEVFVNAVESEAKRSKKPILVFTDLTSQLEADFVHANGGVVVHIVRPGHDTTVNQSDQILNVESIDFQIRNDSDLPTFLSCVDNKLSCMIEKELAVSWKTTNCPV